MEMTRRSLLKVTGAIMATAAVSGCSSSDGSDQVLGPGVDLTYDPNDPAEKVSFNTGAYNCGSRCLHKVHVKNGKITRVTSAGDKPRDKWAEGEWDSTELGKPAEPRACVRCYGGYQGLIYQPDRLKYPLIRKDRTKPKKWDPNAFRRATWTEALTEIVKMFKTAYDKNPDYAPIITHGFYWLGAYSQGKDDITEAKPCFKLSGGESYGGVDLGKLDAVGFSATVNNRSDRFNTKFMITWALDNTRMTYYNIHSHFMNTKVKEKAYGTDIPIVVISANCSDAAAMLSTGIADYPYARHADLGGNAKTVTIPRWIGIRPATDGALATAMAYVIYRNKRHDETYLSQDPGKRKCFGFYPGDKVKSVAPESGVGKSGYPVRATRKILASDPFNDGNGEWEIDTPLNGFNFVVPAGESYQEYLESREVEWGGAPVAAGKSMADGYKYPQPSGPANSAEALARYNAVLEYVSCLTGVNADVIEALAFKYSEYSKHPSDAAFIETGGGAQRAWNAGEWVWSLLGLSAMCGYVEKKGGGLAGMSMCSNIDGLLNSTGGANWYLFSGDPSNPTPSKRILGMERASWQHIVLSGRDHRPTDQFRKDAAYQKVILPADNSGNLVDVDCAILVGSNNMQTHANVNRNVRAYANTNLAVVEQTMTPTAMMADIILPTCTYLEASFDETGEAVASPIFMTPTQYFFRQQAVNKMYDTKMTCEVIKELYDALNKEIGFAAEASLLSESFDVNSTLTYEGQKTTQYYKDHVTKDEKYEVPPLETLRKDGYFTIVVPRNPENSLVPMSDFTPPGTLDTSTGYINFYSPIRAMRPGGEIMPGSPVPEDYLYYPGGWRNATACYQPNMQGYEMFFDKYNDPANARPSANRLGNFTGYKSPFNDDRTGQNNGWNRTYTLYYMTNKSRNRSHTIFDSVAAVKDQFPQVVKMNPADAAARGVKDGDLVYVYNDRGCMRIPAFLSHQILPGVVSVEHGAWYRPSGEKVKVWMQTGKTRTKNSTPYDPDEFELIEVPVDYGGCENILTNDFIGEDVMWCGSTVAAQGGPCEVSRIKPELSN